MALPNYPYIHTNLMATQRYSNSFRGLCRMTLFRWPTVGSNDSPCNVVLTVRIVGVTFTQDAVLSLMTDEQRRRVFAMRPPVRFSLPLLLLFSVVGCRMLFCVRKTASMRQSLTS